MYTFFCLINFLYRKDWVVVDKQDVFENKKIITVCSPKPLRSLNDSWCADTLQLHNSICIKKIA